MRRILRKVAAGERDLEAFGDTSTLADPSIVQTIVDTAPDH
jgi:acetyl-CoA synthetase